MAKTLYLVRHGKSDWTDFNAKDFDRTLNARGNTHAQEMAMRMRARNLNIDYFLSSSAVRALSTAKIFARVFEIENIEADKNLYESSPEVLLSTINKLNDNYISVILFGHNPGLTLLANQLCDANIYNLPTAGVICIEFDIEHWAEVSGDLGKLVFFDYPKNTDEM